MSKNSSYLNALLPRVEVTPEAKLYGRATANGLYGILAVVLALIAGAHLLAEVRADTLVHYAIATDTLVGKAVLALELFLTGNHIQYAVVCGLGFYIVLSELRTLNLVAGLEAKAAPTHEDLKAALRLVRAQELLLALWVLSLIFFGLLSVVALLPKLAWKIEPDDGLTVLSLITVLATFLILQSPIAGFLVHKTLRTRVRKNEGMLHSAMEACGTVRWSLYSIGLVDYRPFYLYCLAKKAGSLKLLCAFYRDRPSPWPQWSVDFERLEANIAKRSMTRVDGN